MPDTVDHRVETFKAAQKLRNAGQPVWTFTVRFAPIFHDESSLTFEERRDQLVGILRRSAWFKSRDDGVFDRLHEIADGLADADDVEEFDGWWDDLYDEADYDRAWIVTRGGLSPFDNRIHTERTPG
jgi:hypothetical protein